MRVYALLGAVFIVLLTILGGVSWMRSDDFPAQTPSFSSISSTPSMISPTPEVSLKPTPPQKILTNGYHVFQSFNNCGPASLSMALSYYEIKESQEALGQALRPYQNPQGDNDDKSVTLEELSEKSKEYGLIPYHRPNGTIDLIRLFVANDIPVIARTLTKPSEDIGHYRIVKGYDDVSGRIIQDDSLQASNLWFTYDEFNALWKQFNYEYLVLVPKEKQAIAEAILGEEINPQVSWEKAVRSARAELERNPDDLYARFNLSVALYNTGDFAESVAEFEKVENRLAFRTLWYQVEPIRAYLELGNYERVFAITDQILNNGNRAFSELYRIRGEIYERKGDSELVHEELRKAAFYNQNQS